MAEGRWWAAGAGDAGLAQRKKVGVLQVPKSVEMEDKGVGDDQLVRPPCVGPAWPPVLKPGEKGQKWL